MSDAADYIKTQWDDIHHSRNQDWRILQIIGAIFIALIAKTIIPPDYKIAIIVVALIVSFIGFYISIVHFIIFRSKMAKIAACEKKLDFADKDPDFDFRFKYGRFAVQQMIMIIYVLIISILLTWLIKITTTGSLWDAVIIPVFVFILGTFLCLFKKASNLRKLLEKPDKNEKIKNNLPKHPLFAEIKDLETCLDLLDKRPLKLIAPELYDNESKWEKDAWSFSVENSKVIDKKVLLNQRDYFQFSIANSKSKQDFHVHKSTLEIYVSDFDIELFLNKGETPDIKAKGVFIIPPNVRHRVKLEGLTYVFQINQKKAKISQDKIIVSDAEYINEDENKNEFTWPDVEKGVDKIITKMEKDGYEPDLVIGIGRSGGIVGGLIAGYLKAKPFRVFNWNYKNVNKNGKKERSHIHDKNIEIEKEQQKILLVEGATTAGQTPEKALAFFKEKFPDKDFRFAVLVRQKSSTASIDYCAYEVLGIKILPWHVKSWPTFLTHDLN